MNLVNKTMLAAKVFRILTKEAARAIKVLHDASPLSPDQHDCSWRTLNVLIITVLVVALAFSTSAAVFFAIQSRRARRDARHSETRMKREHFYLREVAAQPEQRSHSSSSSASSSTSTPVHRANETSGFGDVTNFQTYQVFQWKFSSYLSLSLFLLHFFFCCPFHIHSSFAVHLIF